MLRNQPQWSWPHHGQPRLKRAQHMMQIALLAAAMTLLMSPWSLQRTTPLQSGGNLQISVSPDLYPAFNPNISDYVVVSNPKASLIKFTVNAPRNTKVSVDGQPFRKLSFTTSVKLTPGQSFSFVVNSPGSSKTYYVRSLPTDFPAWVTERPGTPQAEWYIITANNAQRRYSIVFDNYGVPLWWYQSKGIPFDAKLLPNGNIAWLTNDFVEERKLDGTLARTIIPTSPSGVSMDIHELLLLPNGNYVLIANQQRGPVDLSPYGGSATAIITDNIIEEITPDGTLVWFWSSMDHLAIEETTPQWRQQYLVNANQPDPFHMNAIELDGDGYIVSLRHLDAIIRIDRASGDITWKLGGTPRPESLEFVGDPYGNFGGQHDSRVLDDGTVALHDNGTQRNRAPRGVRYRLDLDARTATLLEQVTDADVPGSGCCGSARKLPTSNWVMSWGGRPVVTELTPVGERQFRLTLASFSYRANPLLPGVLSREALRAGMNAQYPR